jgi:hypothetical protein
LDETIKSSISSWQLKHVCEFYGLKLKSLGINDDKNLKQFADTLRMNDVKAVVVTGNALNQFELLDFLSGLRLDKRRNIPFFISNVTPHTTSDIINRISKGGIVGCENFDDDMQNGFYKIADLKNIARELSGQTFKFSNKKMDYFVINSNKNIQSIIMVDNGIDETFLPVFVKIAVNGQEIFLQTGIQPLNKDEKLICSTFDFLEVAPLMMFLRYSCREKCWHPTKNFANLTIDDPWLTEPYGYLNYKRLLEEMEKHNFHTTIAFVPWNFDRSTPDVVSIFNEHPDRFSICIHGNNHDHREFYKYTKKEGDLWPAKSLTEHEENIKQALARMKKFKQMTGLAYDKVMVFPQGIAPAKTLGLLKKYNFLATINSKKIPFGSKAPEDILFQIRSWTLEYENFLSLKRYSASRSQSAIAKDLFLGNPVLLYTHTDFFETGIKAFNNTADIINDIKPDIVWQNLEKIVQHLYLEQLRDDGKFNILTYSNNFIIENTHKRNATFFIQKEESFGLPIKQVIIDGQKYFYKKSENNLILDVFIPAGESRHIIIEYKNDLNLELIDTSKNNLRINILRRLSDFRDITFSTNIVGCYLNHFYYETGLYKVGVMKLVILFLILVFCIISAGYCFSKHGKKT